MPSMNRLRNPDMSNWQQVQTDQSQGPYTPSLPTDPNPINNPARSPFMIAAMPLAASTNDSLGRQYYMGANVPVYRLLPVKRGSDT